MAGTSSIDVVIANTRLATNVVRYRRRLYYRGVREEVAGPVQHAVAPRSENKDEAAARLSTAPQSYSLNNNHRIVWRVSA